MRPQLAEDRPPQLPNGNARTPTTHLHFRRLRGATKARRGLWCKPPDPEEGAPVSPPNPPQLATGRPPSEPTVSDMDRPPPVARAGEMATRQGVIRLSTFVAPRDGRRRTWRVGRRGVFRAVGAPGARVPDRPPAHDEMEAPIPVGSRGEAVTRGDGDGLARRMAHPPPPVGRRH